MKTEILIWEMAGWDPDDRVFLGGTTDVLWPPFEEQWCIKGLLCPVTILGLRCLTWCESVSVVCSYKDGQVIQVCRPEQHVGFRVYDRSRNCGYRGHY